MTVRDGSITLSLNPTSSDASRRWGKVLFIAVLVVCLLQAKKAIDFGGYRDAVRASMESGFHRIPYAAGETATQDDYFQSPVTTLLLIPWSLPGKPAAKFFWLE